MPHRQASHRRLATSLGLAATLSLAGAGNALAEGKAYPPIADAVVAKECGACHMSYPAGLLPAESWAAIVAGLQNHFGENASLDAATTEIVRAYLTANAGVVRRPWWSWSSSEQPQGAPLLRITDQPWFRGEHGPRRLSPDRLARRGAKSPSACNACHRGAEQGFFDDD